MQSYSKRIKKINRLIYIGVAISAVAIFLLIWIINRSVLIMQINPTNSVITVDNKVLYQDDEGRVKEVFSPGTYTLKVEADGYVAYFQEITLKKASSKKLEISLKEAPKAYTISELNDSGDEIAQNVQYISPADDFNSIFYFADNASTLYKAKFKIDSQGSIETVYNLDVSNPPLSDIKKIIWSPKKDAAIFKKTSGVYFFDFKKYNFVNQEEVKYGDNIGDIAWSPDDSKIAYYYAPASGEKSLVFANKTNTEMTRVANFAEMGVENPYLSWSPDSEWLIVIPRNEDKNQNKIYLFNAYTRSLKQISDSGYHEEAMFSPDGEKIIYSTTSEDPSHPVDSVVSIMDKDGSNIKSLNLRAHIGKISWFGNLNQKIIVSTYDTEKKTESIFGYDIENKKKDVFCLYLDNGRYISEFSLSAENNLLFYIANQQFFIVKLN